MKKHIAIFIHGGIGGGLASQGQPAIMRFVEWLASEYVVDVYSHSPASPHFQPKNYRFFSAGDATGNGPWRWFILMRKWWKNHRADHYDIIYAFWGYPAGVVAYVASRLVRAKCIIHLQGGDATGLPSLPYGVFTSQWRAMLCRYVYNRCEVLIGLTNYQRAHLYDRGINRPIEVIPFGISEKLFAFKSREISEPVKFLMVGNLTPVKNWDLALHTFRLVSEQLPSVLTVVGPDYDRQRLQNLCESSSIQNVRFAGHQLYHDLPYFYHDAHILLHTSQYEGQGLIFSEAAFSGTLIAGTRVGLLADMGDECGVITGSSDPADLARKILETIHDPARLQLLIRNARLWTHQHASDEFTRKSITSLLQRM